MRGEWGFHLASSCFFIVLFSAIGLASADSRVDTLQGVSKDIPFSGDPRDPISHSEEIFSNGNGEQAGEDSVFHPPSPAGNSPSRPDPVYSRTLAGTGLVGLSSHLNADPLAYGFLIGRLWGFPPWNAFRIWGQAISDFNGGNFFSVNIGGNLYTHLFDTSPYFGVGSGFGFAEGARESTAGFNFGAAVGIALFRDSDLQVELELENKWLLGKLRRGFPSAALLKLGLLF